MACVTSARITRCGMQAFNGAVSFIVSRHSNKQMRYEAQKSKHSPQPVFQA